MAISAANFTRFVLKPAVWLGFLAPLAWIAAGIAGAAGASLGANPAEYILHLLGKTALNLLLLTLCITPLRQVTGWPHWTRLRRLLGLAAFFYVLAHFVFYLVIDQGMDLSAVLQDIAKRPYITLGFAGLLCLVPLALTSTKAAMRRLGRRWQQLHRLVYLVAVLGCIHYYWQVKADVREPLLYFAMLAVLLGWRLWKHRARTRRSLPAARPAA